MWLRFRNTTMGFIISKASTTQLDASSDYEFFASGSGCSGQNDNKMGFGVWSGSTPYYRFENISHGANNEWRHVVLLYNGTNQDIYVDGNIANGILHRDSCVAASVPSTRNLKGVYRTTIGSASFGTGPANISLDELSFWNRSLSAQEIRDIYPIGTVRLNLTVRSCDDSSCIGENFTDVLNDTPKQTLLPTNASRYFQYRFNFITDDGDYSPQLYNVTIEVSVKTAADALPSPDRTGFGGRTTNFANENNLSSVNKLIIENATFGEIAWLGNNLNVSGANFTQNILL